MNIEELKNKIELKERELKELKEELKNINNYETVAVIDTNATIKRYETIKSKIKEICRDIKVFEELGIKKLAYKIQENKEAFYLRFEWEGIGDTLLELEKYFRENDYVLKFITIRKNDEEE